jgi:hypothetical protein
MSVRGGEPHLADAVAAPARVTIVPVVAVF